MVFRMKTRALVATGVLAFLTAACASAPPAPPAPVVTPEQKLGWILSLEDRRILADPELALAPVTAPAPRRGSTALAYAPAPDLLVLARDPEARTRRRAALAIGRVGLDEGLPSLTALLEDAEPEVRAMAAFSIGLIGNRDSAATLVPALVDLSPLVRGRAAEGLGLICDTPAGETAACEPAVASAIAAMAEGYAAQAAALSGMSGDAGMASTPEADAWRLAAFALVRMRDWPSLSRIALDASGAPVTTWWPVAYALQRVNHAAAVPALRELARAPDVTTAAFAMRGLADHRDEASRALIAEAAADESRDIRVRVTAIRALGRLGGADAVTSLLALLQTPKLDDNLRLETVTALGAIGDARALNPLLDLLADDWPVLRAAALGAVARLDPENFTLVLSGLLPDADWRVRAALARTLATLPQEIAAPRLTELWADEDKRVHGAALAAAVAAKLPEAEAWIRDALKGTDPGEQSAAVSAIGRLEPSWGAETLAAAYAGWASDPDYGPRAAALAALAGYGLEAARGTLTAALEDRDWAVRVRARELLERLGADPVAPGAIRPVPNAWPADVTVNPSVVAPPYSPHVYFDTRHGTIEIELDVVNAPLTAWNFLELARKGFYYGVSFHRVVPNFVVQAGDPRGDGEGGAGRTIRDELSPVPYQRGTVGMALSWPDTGGSQFFITHGPSPHLDGRYTVFGRVVSGMEVVDRIRQGDVITAVRVRTGQ